MKAGTCKLRVKKLIFKSFLGFNNFFLYRIWTKNKIPWGRNPTVGEKLLYSSHPPPPGPGGKAIIKQVFQEEKLQWGKIVIDIKNSETWPGGQWATKMTFFAKSMVPRTPLITLGVATSSLGILKWLSYRSAIRF